MPFKIVRNDITKMETDAIVNTANRHVAVDEGCDIAIYTAAGYEKLLEYRKSHIGEKPEGSAFITPGFDLKAKYIIHTVSPLFIDGNFGEEEKLRSCYQNSLKLAMENGIRSISFPLISTGSFGYPKEEGLRIAIDEISAFLIHNDILVYLVVFDEKSTSLAARVYPGLDEYIDNNYVDETPLRTVFRLFDGGAENKTKGFEMPSPVFPRCEARAQCRESIDSCADETVDFETVHENKLNERMKHLSDTFSEYLLYLISERGMENAEVYKRAIVDKKTFSKIKNNTDYHPQKITALCLCVGAMLNLDETKDLLARAGYALSPCDKTDIIFSYFIENEIYDMIELDIQLEEHGLPCVIS